MSAGEVMTHDAPDVRRAWLLICGAIAVEAVVLGVWSALHGVNADEGFYIAAGWHAAQGRHLYGDVFFPQMPYLPWIEAGLFRMTGPSLDAARALSVAGGALGAGIVTGLAWQQEQSFTTALIVAVLYVCSGVLLNGLAIIKTYGIANLCLLTGFAVLALGLARQPVWAFCAGLAAACAVGVRLAVAPAAIVLAFMAWRCGIPALIAFALGGLVGSLPWLWAAASYPAEFWFGNVTFHALRREITGATAIVMQKLGVVTKWVLLPQHLLLWALVAIGCWRAGRRVWPAAACTLVLAATYAAATPTYLEYMAQFVPFALLAGAPAIAWLLRTRVVATCVVALYLVGLYPLLAPNESGTARGDKRDLWRRSNVDEIAAYIRDQSAPTDAVLSWWEGYPILSDRPGYVGVGFWESNMAKKLPAETARRFHVMQHAEIRELIQQRDPKMIVVADGNWDDLRSDIESGYTSAKRVNGIQVYARR